MSNRTEKLITEAIEQKNVNEFHYLLDVLKINPDKKLNCFDNLSVFEKLLTIPTSRPLIQLCLQFGSYFYRKNVDGIFPLQFAVESLCADNLKTILKYSDDSSDCNFDDYGQIEHLLIFNQKIAGGENFLHWLVRRLTEENYDEVAGMIKIMLRNGCNSNLLNDKMETPFHLLLKKLQTIDDRMDLIDFITEKSAPFLTKEIVDLMKMREIWNKYLREDQVNNFSYLLKLLKEWNESAFIEQFKQFEEDSVDSQHEFAKLLEEAVIRNFSGIVRLFIDKGVDVNGASNNHKPPAFLACKFGHHEVLRMLLTDEKLLLKCQTNERSLLSEICKNEKVHNLDRQKCFDLIISDPRCTLEVINGVDESDQPPLYYASRNGFSEIAKELLRRGAYIGHDSIISSIDEKVLREYLDESIRCQTDLSDKKCEIHLDFRFLTPPCEHKKCSLEVRPVHKISRSPKLKALILHPVIVSFLELKWKKIDFIVYLNLLIYFLFMMFLGCFIITFFHHSVYSNYDFKNDIDLDQRGDFDKFGNELEPLPEKLNIFSLLMGFSSSNVRIKRSTENTNNWNKRFYNHFQDHKFSYIFCVFGVVLITIYEIIQCARSYKKYFFKLSNWFDIALIALSFFVLLGSFDLKPESFKQVRAITILIMAAQTIQLVGKVSLLSMSLHMAIFKRVCVTFFKTFALYLILILAFAMSFYTLYDDEDKAEKGFDGSNSTWVFPNEEKSEDSFADPFMAIITIVRMMLSDFDQITINSADHFEGFVFLLFVTLITVVLFNLLNALAISDTAEMMNDAERVDIKKRITILYSYEKFFSMCHLSFAHILPEMSSITITPNKHNFIKMNRNLDAEEKHAVKTSQKSGIAERFEYILQRKFKFWKEENKTNKLCNKIITKIVKFVEVRNENESLEMDKKMFSERIKKVDEIQRMLKTFENKL